jgi:hypothetical protein
MKRKQLKRTVTVLAVVVFSGAIGTAAMAQERLAYNPDISRTEVANLDHYLDRHPEVAQQLQQHPGLVDNRQYVASHPGLHAYLATHPVGARRM